MKKRASDRHINYTSEHTWMSLLNNDYSNLFDGSFNKHPHYLDTVICGFDIVNIGKDKQDDCTFTALDNDLFLHLRLYAGEDGKPIIFDLGYTLEVTPDVSDFIGRKKLVQKIMNRLGATSNVIGKGTIIW